MQIFSKQLNRKLAITLCAVLLVCAIALSVVLFIPSNETVEATSVMSSALDLEAGNNLFNGYSLDTLYGYIVGGATSYKELDSQLSGNNGDILKTYADINGGNGVTVKLGSDSNGNAYEWNVVAASKNQDGEVVVTLWLSKSEYNARFSIFNSDSVDKYASSEYGMSEVRATLVQDAEFANSISTKTNSQNVSYNKNWKTLLDNYGTYIDSPFDVCGTTGYQATQKSTLSNINKDFLFPNEAYLKYSEEGTGDGQWVTEIAAKVQNLADYGQWKSDKLWLPSLSETGDTSTYTGLWDITNDKVRANTTSSWLRSGSSVYPSYACYMPAAGNDAKSFEANNSLAVRPAIHLNLAKAEANADRSLAVPTDVSSVYNGEKQDLSTLTTKPAWYKDSVYGDSSKISVEYPQGESDMLDVSSKGYEVKVTILDTEKYSWADGDTNSYTRTFKFIITKAPLSVSTLRVDEYGNLLDEGSDVTEIITNTYLTTLLFKRDVGQSSAPQFELQYRKANGGTWSTDKPTIAGNYEVRAYITNPDESNYYLVNDGQTTFIRPKQYVETPHFTQDGLDSTSIVGSTTTVQYSGDYQVFKLVNTTDGNLVDVTVGARNGGISYDQQTGTFRAKAVGVYTVEVLLADGGANTQWNTDSAETSRTITLIITKAELTVNILESDMTSWTKGDIDYITIHVTGVRNSENVTLDVYYTVSGSSTKTYVADSAMTLEGDTIIVTVNLATFDTNKEYSLYVSLRDNIAANDNYTLVNNDNPYKFFIMTATINDDDELVEEWTISNLISGTKNATDAMEVDYNGSSYTMSLDESKLPKGVTATYSNGSFADVKNDGGYYTTKVTLTCQSGYQFASGKSSVSFEITWKINPIVFDIANLEWSENPEWSDGETVGVSIINIPSWLDGWYELTGNTGTSVKNYTAICTLYSEGNYVFVYSGADSDHYMIEEGGRQATLTHDWKITKKVINVTNAPKQWTTEKVEYTSSKGYYTYNIYVPAGLAELVEQGVINVTYWGKYENGIFSDQINIKELEVDYSSTTGTTYYIKIEIANDWKDSYEMYNTLTKADFAFTSFVVGGDKSIIEVTYDKSDELMYNGQPQGITAKYRNLQFIYTYYKITDSGDEQLSGAPTDVGNYKVVVSLNDGDSDSYWIQNSVYYFSITPLVLTTNGYQDAKGNELKRSVVIADGVSDTSPYFKYKVFDMDGKEVLLDSGEQLKYNTTYTVKLVIADEYTDNVVWADDAVTTYIFTTSYNPKAETDYLQDPTITVTDSTGNTVSPDSVVWTGEIFTVTINNWATLSQYVTVTVDGLSDVARIASNGIYTVSGVGLYTFTITINEDALQSGAAAWLWDDGSASKTVTFEITTRYVAIPKANGELVYNGQTQYLFPNGYDQDYINVSDDAVLSATEIGGAWTVTLSLKDKTNTCWADGTTDDKTFTWSIVEASQGPDDPNTPDDPNKPGNSDDNGSSDLGESAEKVAKFIRQHWAWFVVAYCIRMLLLLIVVIAICIAARRRRKYNAELYEALLRRTELQLQQNEIRSQQYELMLEEVRKLNVEQVQQSQSAKGEDKQ